jgi:hypothetical protein
MNIVNVLALFGVAFMLAFLLEGAVEYLFGTPMDHIEKAKPFKWLLLYPSLVFGVLLCFYYKLDLIILIVYVLSKISGGELIWPVTPVGIILSGVLIGHGANYLYDFLVLVLKKKPPLPLEQKFTRYFPPMSVPVSFQPGITPPPQDNTSG